MEHGEGALLAQAQLADHRGQRLRGAQVRLDLAIFELGDHTGIEAQLLQLERLRAPEERALHGFQPPVERLQREVAAHHVAHER